MQRCSPTDPPWHGVPLHLLGIAPSVGPACAGVKARGGLQPTCCACRLTSSTWAQNGRAPGVSRPWWLHCGCAGACVLCNAPIIAVADNAYVVSASLQQALLPQCVDFLQCMHGDQAERSRAGQSLAMQEELMSCWVMPGCKNTRAPTVADVNHVRAGAKAALKCSCMGSSGLQVNHC